MQLLGERPHKLLVAAVTLGDLAEALLPQRSHIRRGGSGRQRLHQRPPSRGRLDALALTHQKTAFEQQVDDTGPGRLGAEAIGLAQGLANFGILHIAGDAGHGRQQGGIGERLGRLGHLLLQLTPLAEQLFALLQSGQGTGLLFVVILLHSEQRLPARFQNAPRLGLKQATGDAQQHLAVVVFERGIELQQVLTGNQAVKLRLVGPQCGGIALLLGGNDGVVGIHLAVVPRLAADIAISLGNRPGQRWSSGSDGAAHLLGPLEVVSRQITAVGARIGDELVALVEALADVEHPLGIHAEALGGIDLQAGEVIGQRRRLLAGLLLHRLNLCGLAIDPAHHLVGQRPVEHPPLLVLPRQASFGRQPLGGEALVAIGQQMGQHLVEGFGDEGLDLEIPPHHQPEQRGLYTTDREQLAATGLAPEQGVGAGHVDAVEPVGPTASQRRDRQRHELLVVSELVEGTAHRGRVEIADEAALHRPGFRVAEKVDHLVHQQLSFPVRVTGVDHAVGLLDQPLDDGELGFGLGFGHQLPLGGDDGEMLHPPLLEGGVIGIWLGLLQQVADTPGDHISLGGLDKTVALLVGLGQGIGNGAPQSGLLGDEESHR